MKGFKAQIKRDLKTVFHNADEHADNTQIEYNGKKYNIPVVTDSEGTKDRINDTRNGYNVFYQGAQRKHTENRKIE